MLMGVFAAVSDLMPRLPTCTFQKKLKYGISATCDSILDGLDHNRASQEQQDTVFHDSFVAHHHESGFQVQCMWRTCGWQQA